jgi:hypothetical protein
LRPPAITRPISLSDSHGAGLPGAEDAGPWESGAPVGALDGHGDGASRAGARAGALAAGLGAIGATAALMSASVNTKPGNMR